MGRARGPGLDREPAELEARITGRVEEMVRVGLIEEVERLRAAGLEKNPSAAIAKWAKLLRP